MPKCVQNSLSDQVYTMLKEQILSGQLKGGMKIPEELLAEQFGVSRTPIREAIRRLSEYGLVTIKPRSHAIVSVITQKEANDIARVRVSLEQLAIDSIDEQSYAQNVKEFSRYAADCQYAMGIGDRATVFEQDSLFHLALIRASNNSALINICERLDAKIQQLRIAQDLPEDELSYYLNQHAQMMNLLKNGDKEACKRLLYEHITHDLTSHVLEKEA
ncbi:MAG: GntR family transcriptional regulator [Sphaerochaeta sp.]|nr:GntR family transcriptional regulator [Sphaerochaeta sp.]